MMDDLKSLYQDLIIDHSKHPRCRGKLDHATHDHEGFNPICGDRVHIFIQLHNETIEAIAFDGSGCSICMATSSMMCEALKQKTIHQMHAVWSDFHGLMDGKTIDDTTSLGKLAALKAVNHYPMRVKCATLPWHTLKAALNKQKHQQQQNKRIKR